MKGGFTVRISNDRKESDAAFGCLIILFSGCAFIGGILYFLKIVIALISGNPIN